jgi:protein-S-isoprenylcysteine O-methyltransferase Ste14
VGFGIGIFLFNLAFFTQSSIGDIDRDMSKKYGSQWADYKRRVPYALIPGVY